MISHKILSNTSNLLGLNTSKIHFYLPLTQLPFTSNNIYNWHMWVQKNTKRMYIPEMELYTSYFRSNPIIVNFIPECKKRVTSFWQSDQLIYSPKLLTGQPIFYGICLRNHHMPGICGHPEKNPLHASEESRKAQTSKTIFLPRKFTDSTRFPAIHKKIVYLPF